MEIKRVTRDFAVSPQLLPADLSTLAAAGFRAVICNRPDGEGADQPLFAEIAAAAQAAGIEARYLPVETGKVGDDTVTAFAELLRALPGPVLAFCRSGTRSIITWSLGEAMDGARSRDELVELGLEAGYDLNGVLPA